MSAGKREVPGIGIDLGTTYPCVGVWQLNRVGNRRTISYVPFTDSEKLIGNAAKKQVAMNPISTVFDAKRFIGRRYIDSSVQRDLELCYKFGLAVSLEMMERFEAAEVTVG